MIDEDSISDEMIKQIDDNQPEPPKRPRGRPRTKPVDTSVIPREVLEQALPWERQIGEGYKPYAAFIKYRDSTERNKSQVSDELGHKQRVLVYRWASDYKWDERCLAYDNHMTRVECADKEQQIKKTNTDNIAIAFAFKAKVCEALKTLDPKKLSTKDMGEWLKIATEIEREAFGENNGKTTVNITNNSFKEIVHKSFSTDAEMLELIETLRDAGALNDYATTAIDANFTIDTNPRTDTKTEGETNPTDEQVCPVATDSKADGGATTR